MSQHGRRYLGSVVDALQLFCPSVAMAAVLPLRKMAMWMRRVAPPLRELDR